MCFPKGKKIMLYFYLLRVSAMGYWLIFIILQKYVTESTIRDILNNMPPDRKLSTPPILLPVVRIIFEIYRPNHLSDTTELSTCIDLQAVVYKVKEALCSNKFEDLNK